MLDRFVDKYHATQQLTRDIPREGGQTLLTQQQSDLITVTQTIFSHFLCYLKPFKASEALDSLEHYYMEREWRVPARVKFQLGDVQRIIVPSEFGQRLRKDLPDYFGQ